ncbi:MAG: hypothetical protein ABWZ82_08645 [Candidatus Limnocylindrales bacterium]
MSRLPRVLALMGSGETAPTMAKVHRALFARLPADAPGALLDTPYGFQENADEITSRALEYFAQNIGHPLALAPFRRADAEPLTRATAIARAREAGFLFAGPGSPSYTLAQWQGSELPGIIADKLRDGGIVVFASAAALTVGAHTVPVYEIYKVGDDPTWLPGLDLLGPLGMSVAVIPHYDNDEGGTHDTRYCYLGESRLRTLEAALPEGHFVLGIDSHTALLLDLDDGTTAVEGLGGVTIRVAGRSHVLPAGTSTGIDTIGAVARSLAEASRSAIEAAPPIDRFAPAEPARPDRSPLSDEVRELETRFDDQLAQGAVEDAIGTLLALDQVLLDWSRDTEGTGEIDRARSAYRSCIVRLGEHAAATDRTSSDDRLAPLVDLLVDLRDRARADRDWRRADWIRDALTEAGIEVQDAPEGTTWRYPPTVPGRVPGRARSSCPR